MAAKSNNIAIVVISGIVLVGGVITAIWLGTKKDGQPLGNPLDLLTGGGNSGGGTSGGNTSGNTGGIFTPPALNYNKVLKNGVSGEEVKALQLLLNKVEVNSPLVVDGKFGPLTEAKLKRFNNGYGEITLAVAKLKWPY
jgi:hypothetical protein